MAPNGSKCPFNPGSPWRPAAAVAFAHVSGRERREGTSYRNEKDSEVGGKVMVPMPAKLGRMTADTVGGTTPHDTQQRLLGRPFVGAR